MAVLKRDAKLCRYESFTWGQAVNRGGDFDWWWCAACRAYHLPGRLRAP
jgi:hypothetical protein